MVRSALVGTRIREKRATLRLRQADLARAAGISAAYLNLIEHNRRRVGDALLDKLARELGTDTISLLEGAENALFDGLREAAGPGVAAGLEAPELDRIEEFVSRFPGWAAALAERQARVAMLERLVETYADRFSQDPFLLDALHEVLSVVTSLRSSAAILTETEDLEPEWQTRFLQAIAEESVRLSGTAEALVRRLDGMAAQDTVPTSPLEQLEAWLSARDWTLPEPDAHAGIDTLIARAPELTSPAARALAHAHATRADADARALPLAPFLAALIEDGPEPARLAARFGVPMGAVFRRLATLPPAPDLPGGRLAAGLMICDGSGTLTFRRPVPGFAAPRFGAACPLWPLYEALGRPMQPLRAVLEMVGRLPRRYLAYAFASPRAPDRFDGPVLTEAMMLVLPAPAEAGGRSVGVACRVCPRPDCAGRHEPSILPGD